MVTRSALALVAGLACLAAAGPVRAADPAAPVRDIMQVATALWGGNGETPADLDYFDKTHIQSFSKAFRDLYAEGTKHPVFAEEDDPTGSPFDYDPIVGGQDGCPIEELKITVGPAKGGVTDVSARFKHFTCFEDTDTDWKAMVSEVHFDVVAEGGKPVIADVHRQADGGWDSLVAELKTIIAQ